jgi:hypothetical protein
VWRLRVLKAAISETLKQIVVKIVERCKAFLIDRVTVPIADA